MPLYKPKFLTPGGENRTIDLQDSNPNGIEFSCVVDGNAAIKKYKIDIWLMTDENTHFTKTVILSSSTTPPYPFFPVNEKNEYNLFKFYLSKTELSNANIVNSSNPYKWQISMWEDGNENNLTPDTVSCEEVFYGNKAPTISLKYKSEDSYISFDDTPLKSKIISFKCIYSQEQNVPLRRFGWYIKNITTDTELFNTVDDGKMIYGSASNITLTYDGFLNNEDYLIKCKIVTQNGFELETSQQFSINFQTYDITSDFTIEPLSTEAGNLLSWGNVRAITGTAYNSLNQSIPPELLDFESNYPVDEKTSVFLSDGNKIVFEEGTDDKLDLSEDITLVYSGQFENNDDRTILELSGSNSNGNSISRRLEIKDKKFVYTVANGADISVKASDGFIFNSNNWFIIVMYPLIEGAANLRITNRKTVGSLFPSTSLFSSSATFAKFGIWEGE